MVGLDGVVEPDGVVIDPLEVGLAVWGYPLSYIPPYPRLGDFVEMLLRGMEESDGKSFAEGFEGLCRTIFHSSREKMISVGIAEAEKLKLL